MIPVDVETMLASRSPETVIAVVGASSNPSKYGNIIVRRLKENGYTVRPVNPRDGQIEGLPVWRRVDDIPDPVHLVSFVTPPDVTLEVLRGMDPARFGVVWFQDGSWDDDCAGYADSRFGTVVRNACILVAMARLGPIRG